MTSNEKRILEREALRSVIQQWNANRLDLFELSEPDDNLQFHGVMRFYFQDHGCKVATKCIRVASDATVADVIDTLIEKFRPDMRMLSVPSYHLYEVHSNGEERKLNADEKPLLVQLNWHIDDREGRFLLRNTEQKAQMLENYDTNFKRKLSKREKKEQKKKEKLAKLSSTAAGDDSENNHVAEKLYNELPETSFTRSISNPEAVMRRRRQQILEKKLQQFRSKDGGPDTGGTLKIYGESLCRDVPYKTLLLSIRDCAQAVVREMLAKYGLDKTDPLHYCLVQVNSDGSEYILDDDECPLSILMNHPTSRGSIMFHVRRRPADSQPRRRKKKPLGVTNGGNNVSVEREGPTLVEIAHNGDGGRRVKLNAEPVEVGSANTNTLQLFGPSIQPRHCLISLLEGVCTVTPLHADALTFVNGHNIQQPTILHNGSVVMFGRGASFRFIDSPSDGRYNLALSQSQLDSACLYESRSPTSPSWQEEDRISTVGPINSSKQNYLGMDSVETRSIHVDAQLDDGKQTMIDSSQVDITIEMGTNIDTKSVSSNKSVGSNQELRSNKIQPTSSGGGGQEPILPAVLEFPETYQEAFLNQVITELDVDIPNFKLAPVYTLYLCARYRASTHYRPDLQPTERAQKLTVFLHHVANLIYHVIHKLHQDPKILSFWMANSSEFLHFLKSDRHISAFSVQAQELLAESVQTAFRSLVTCFRVELSQTLNQFLSENIDHESAAGLVLTVLGSAMALLRRCRVNAALTIQLFSQLFHYINVICFNTVVTNPQYCTPYWGKVISDRLSILESWAHRQGLELAAECHLAKINQCADFLQAPKSTTADVQQLACSCFRLNSIQMAALLAPEKMPKSLMDTAIRMAESVADELTRSDGREVCLEESTELPLALLIPDDGFSSDVVRGIPAGLVDFVNNLQAAGMCRIAAQPTSIGLWTVYMHQFNVRSSSSMSTKLPQPEVQIIKLHKNTNGMGLSIVAAKGAGQERLGIYIKSVVPGGAADADGRLQAGDQLLKVDGQSLIGITQERAADYLVRTGPVVTLDVAKQGAIYHGLATLLQQPSPVIHRGNRRMSERDLTKTGNDGKPPLPAHNPSQQLLNSKSVPSLHHVGNIGMSGNKSQSIHNLTGNSDPSFYQNLSVYRQQNQSQPSLERTQNSSHPSIPQNISNQQSIAQNQQQTQLNRPASAYFNSTNTLQNQQKPLMPSSNTMPSFTVAQQLTQQMPANGTNTLPPSMAHNRLKPNFARDTQTQQSLRMNQMMAPSMPNIAHSSGYATNISASQSMHNVNMIPPNKMLFNPPGHHPGGYIVPNQMGHHSGDLPQQPNPYARGSQGKFTEMNEMLKRRHQRQEEMMPMQALDGNKFQSSMPNLQNSMSPQKPQLPPTAPKPQIHNRPMYPQQYNEGLSPPLPPPASHPLYRPLDPNIRPYSSGKITAGSNPWEREEREKEQEIRREHIRHWRDMQINDLSTLPYLTGQQEEQLKQLILERDFERRVQEQDENDDDNETTGSYDGKTSHPETIRLTQTPITNLKQVEIKTTIVPTVGQPSTDPMPTDKDLQNYPIYQTANQPKSILKHNSNRTDLPPGSIQQSSPSSPSKQIKSASFVDDPRTTEIVGRDLSNLHLKNYDEQPKEWPIDDVSINDQQIFMGMSSATVPPPPPPERNSSYSIMSQKQQNLLNAANLQQTLKPSEPPPNNNFIQNPKSNRTNQMSMNNGNIIGHPQSASQLSITALMAQRNAGTVLDNKRVSFHDEENNFIGAIPTGNMIGADGSYIIPNFDGMQDDSNRFSQDPTTPITPTTPDNESWNTTVQQTPGVIGAQEVYRDPRARRLQEQQQQLQQKSGDAVPEKLTFKEKMKMFALESGENQTPKDKLKISRAQRDIDAVH